MKSLPFMPLTYLAGVHGFMLFAPYLALFFAAVLLLRRRRRLRMGSQRVQLVVSAGTKHGVAQPLLPALLPIS